MALITIADRGPGIPEQELGRIFEKFYRAKATDRQGVGLGLAIARGIVNAHGGKIAASNREAQHQVRSRLQFRCGTHRPLCHRCGGRSGRLVKAGAGHRHRRAWRSRSRCR